MSVQSGVTQSSPISRLANSYRQSEHGPRYYDLSGSSQVNSNPHKTPTNSRPIIKYNKYSTNFKHQNPIKVQYPSYNNNNDHNNSYKLSKNLSEHEYNICCRTFAYCFVLIICGILMILSRKLQNQTITKNENNNQYLYFRHQWIQTWFFFIAKTLLIIIILCPCYNATAGISQTYHSQILLNHNRGNGGNCLSRQNKAKSFCRRQLIYIMLSLNLVFGQFFLNVALFYMSASIWTIFLSITILYVSAFKFFLIEPSIIVFIGVFCIITGNIMMISTEIHQLQIVNNYSMTIAFFGFASFCLGVLFMTFYYMIYEYYYEEYKAYCNLLIKLKTLRKSKKETFSDDFSFKHNIEKNLIFYNWNHIHFLYMEGIYGLFFTSIIIIILIYIDMDVITGDVHWWFYENISNFINCLKYNIFNIVTLIIYVFAIIFNDITLEISKSYLSSFHSKLIYFVTILCIWCIDLLLHLIATPTTNKMFDDNNNIFYGELITWYSILEAGALLFIVLGITLFDEKYVVYLNGMIEHNGLIIKQQRINILTKYWNDKYYKKEKERLCGFSPIHLKINNYNNYNNDINKMSLTDYYDDELNNGSRNIIDENKDESSYNYHELSINSYNRDGTKLEGTINLLIGGGVSNALNQGPTKYYPALYE